MLNFSKGFPIAKIKGGKHDGKKLRILVEDRNKKKKPCCKKCKGGCMECGGKCCDKCFENVCLHQADKISNLDLDEDDPMYFIQKEINKLKKNQFEEIVIDDGDVIPLPQKEKNEKENQTDSLFIGGPKGSGKSFFTANYVKQFKKMFPKRKVYLFSDKPKDPVLDKLKVKRIAIDDNLLDDPLDYQMFKKSLVIFDDYETIDKKYKEEVDKILNKVLKCGRSLEIYCIITNHRLTNYKMTRDFLNESNMIVMFPGNSSINDIRGVLRHYGGYGEKDVQKVLSLNSRWSVFHKNTPQYILHENGAFMLNRKPKVI